MGNSNLVVGIGELLWDMLPSGKRLGGAPTNFAYHVSQFGLKGVAVSAVGQDDLGDKIIGELEKNTSQHALKELFFPLGELM